MVNSNLRRAKNCQHQALPGYKGKIQLYVSVYPNELPDLINRFEHCVAEVKTWMKVNRCHLKLNDEKMRLSY